MKLKPNEIDFPSLAPEPTIWALRKNPRAQTVTASTDDPTLYEHLFGYDPISLLRRQSKADTADMDAGATSAENPNLNIINPETNYAVMELASDLEPDPT